jgi:hypothetical protein
MQAQSIGGTHRWAMAEAAVQRGPVISVAATLATTLNPTLRLIRSKAADLGRSVGSSRRRTRRIKTDGGRSPGTCSSAGELLALAAEVDVIVLAQASMARVLPSLPENIAGSFLTSARSVEQVKAALTETNAENNV